MLFHLNMNSEKETQCFPEPDYLLRIMCPRIRNRNKIDRPEKLDAHTYSIHPLGKMVMLMVCDSVADPGSGAFLTLVSGMGKKSGSGIRIRDERLESYFRELRNHFFG
jgi:hypothetical protein